MSTQVKPGTPQVEAMDRAAWKQTLKDLPVAILGYGLGMGVARTVMDLYGEQLLRSGQKPSWAKYAPHIAGGLSSAASIVAARQRGILKERRDEARRRENEGK